MAQRRPVAREDQRADFIGDDVERHDGERVGVERDDHCDGQIDAERDREQRRSGELHRVAARHEPREHARRHAARHRSAIEVPEVRVAKQRAEARDEPVLPDRLAARQIFSKEFSWHGRLAYQPRRVPAVTVA